MLFIGTEKGDRGVTQSRVFTPCVSMRSPFSVPNKYLTKDYWGFTVLYDLP